MRLPSTLGSNFGRSSRIRRLNVLYIVVCILLSLVVIAISVSVSFELVNRDPLGLNEDSKPGVNVDVELISLDPVAGTLVVDIDPWFDDRDVPIKSCTDRQFNLFMDQNIAIPGPDSEHIPNSNVTNKPAFQIIYLCNGSWRQDVPTFRATLKLFLLPFDPAVGGARHKYGHIGSGLQAYPFDSYYTTLYLWAEEQLSGNRTESTPINLGVVRGVVANFHTPMIPFYHNQAEVYGISIDFSVDRSAAVKAFCFTIIITNWIVSLIFLWITVACIIWKERVVKELFAIPIATLFAFSAVRSTMPGAPNGFGAFVDYVGILPNFAILTACSFVLIVLVLVERIRNNRGNGPDASQDEMPEKE